MDIGHWKVRLFRDADRLKWILPFAILAAPSVYLLVSIPPLWRDSDGFWQITGKFNDLTLLHWPPLYCFVARLPIALGEILSRLPTGNGIFHISVAHPVMTDLGLSLLLVAQHALLTMTLLFACVSATKSCLFQVLIAGFFALNPALYAFAHTVGSEALSNVFILLTAILAYRCICNKTASKGILVAFFLSLVLAILSRHINGLLAGLLPGAFLLSFVINKITNLLARDGIGSSEAVFLRNRFVSFTVLGVGAIAAANAVTILACHRTKTPFRSKIGATFEWRLNYLETISPRSQIGTLNAIDHNLNDPAISYALGKARALLATGHSWDPTTIHAALFEWLSAHGTTGWRRLRLEVDKRLNRIAMHFLLTGGPEFWAAVLRSFWNSLNYSSADVCREAFKTTDLLVQFSVDESFRSIRHLATFQSQKRSYESRWSRDAYLSLGRSVRLWELTLLTFFGALWSLSFRGKGNPQLSAFLISLVVTGTAITFSNCALAFDAPRFCLPLYCLVLVGLAILVGLSVEKRFNSSSTSSCREVTAKYSH